MKSWLKTTLKIVFAAAIISWLVSTGKIDFKILKKLLDIRIILISLTLVGITFWVATERWLLLLKSQNLPTRRLQAWKLTMIGIFFNFVVPGGVGGDFIKGYYVIAGNPQDKMKAAVTVAMDRLVGLYTMLLTAVVVMALDWDLVSAHSELRAIFYFLFSVSAAFSVFWLLIFSRTLSNMPWIHRTLHFLPKGEHLWSLFESFSSYAVSKKLIFQTIALSFLGQTCAVALFIFLGISLGYNEIAVPTYFFVVPTGMMVMAIPIAPAGVGIGQTAFYYLFNITSGFESSAGSVLITGFQIFQFTFGLLGAWYYTFGLSGIHSLAKDTSFE